MSGSDDRPGRSVSRALGVPLARLLPAVAGLAALAVSQPLLDLTARQPQFLIAHGLSPLEVVLLAVGVVLLPPSVLAFASLGGRARAWWAGAAIAVPVALISLYAGGRMGLAGTPLVALSVALAAGSAVLYIQRRSVQEAARYLAAVPLVVLAYFFLVVPSAVLAGDESSSAIGQVARPVPVVVIVLDELPLASLIDSRGSLLARQYPAFARLAADGVWYRNAITVETRTTESIPAILTGRQIDDGQVPNHASHPHNLMTMLAGSHHVRAVEPVTRLCPPTLCPTEEDGQWSTLVSDLAVVYGHLVVPEPWSGRLPAIDQNWTDFVPEPSWDLVEAVGEAVQADRRADADSLLASLQTDQARPILRVAHLVLPHRPWEFLPDGRRHGQRDVDGYGGRGWGPDPYLMADGWRRHLFQVGYSDAVLGELLAELDRLGLYGSALVVVVADHGVHFAPDVVDMRVTNRDSLGSILPVPLFVKYPAHVESPPPGSIDDRRVETIDVVPTVLDVVDAQIPSSVEGHSLLTPFERNDSILELRGEPFLVPGDGDEKLGVVTDRDRWFEEGDPWSLVPDSSLRDLLGRPLPETPVPRTRVGLIGGGAPPMLEGEVNLENQTGREVAALTDGDGFVRAVSRIHPEEEGRARFFFFVRPGTGARGPWEAHLLADIGE